MKNALRVIGALAAVVFCFAAASTLHAEPYSGSAVVSDMVTVSGVWTSVQWYKSDGCYSGVGDPAVSDWKDRAQNNTPISLATNASDSYGDASSDITVNAPGLVPTISIHSSGHVYGLALSESHWASAFSMGGANWLTSGATQTVTVTIDYSYDLDLLAAHPGYPYAFAKIYVAFWGPSSNLMLTADEEFVQEGNYLVKTVLIEGSGTGTGTVTGSKSWEVNVSSGAFYSFWSQAWGEVCSEFDPTGTEPITWGAIKALSR